MQAAVPAAQMSGNRVEDGPLPPSNENAEAGFHHCDPAFGRSLSSVNGHPALRPERPFLADGGLAAA
jgi:hypothetical protein